MTAAWSAIPMSSAGREWGLRRRGRTPLRGGNGRGGCLSRLTRQCLDRRIDNLDLLNSELAAWQADANADERKVIWQFTSSDARIKLRHLYPQL